MTIEKLNELKSNYQKEVDYYSKISFDVLRGKFQEVVKILAEIEDIIKENEKLKARVQVLEEKLETQATIIDAAREESEEF